MNPIEISTRELADIVNGGRLGKQISLKQISPTRWRGLCPFHGDTRNPNFDVYEARPGAKGRFICHACEEKGDAIEWLRRIEGKTWNELRGAGRKLDTEPAREKKREARIKRIERMFLDAYPDACPEWSIIIGGLR